VLDGDFAPVIRDLPDYAAHVIRLGACLADIRRSFKFATGNDDQQKNKEKIQVFHKIIFANC
jgi:hypothetical protein